MYNVILDTDSYKCSMFVQYPPGTEYVYSYVESRGGKWDRTVMFGLQILLKKWRDNPITMAMIDEAEAIITAHGEPFNRAGWEHIVKVHGGRLPILIKAVREGTIVEGKNVLLTIVNTDPACYWLTTYLETALLRAIWYAVTVSTLSWQSKQVIRHYLDLSSDTPEDGIQFKLHDFGARGVSSEESAAIGGLAHLVHFLGTDNLSAVVAARRYYGADMAGYSIPAAEHSTITSWLRQGEVDAYRNMLRQFAKPGAAVAVVSDSYDLFNAVDNIWGGELKAHVIDSKATLIVRPDSGDPETIPVEVVKRLAAKFGTTLNNKGYHVLKGVRVIQGDGITVESLKKICENLIAAKFSLDNLAFGMGGGLLQMVNRDDLKFAMKCSAICVDGVWRDVFKDPITDQNKRSKRGRLALIREHGYDETVPYEGNQWRDELVQVFKDGLLLREWSLEEVRSRAETSSTWKVAA
jgi:nicotinamide phosphoribosyltransferase